MLDTLANVKSRLGITSTEHDTFLTQQIQLISDVIESYCGRKFIEDDYVQTFYSEDYNLSNKLELYHFPITEITSIEEDDVALASTDYRAHNPSATITKKAGCFFMADETVVTYSAGYTSCPTQILAVLDSLINERYTKKTSGVDMNFGANVQRLSIPGSISIDFDYTLTSNKRSSAYGTILGSNSNILDAWRSERMVVGGGKLQYVEEQETGP